MVSCSSVPSILLGVSGAAAGSRLKPRPRPRDDSKLQALLANSAKPVVSRASWKVLQSRPGLVDGTGVMSGMR
jgi:hypothetical protein